ncbi:hypothetical protein KMW28_02980 [Flammeovirga yaeyamensis]|uniref:Lipoprotein n=1 Tax=Flammeovirga yaeyamensis TaxID=367791 RepID=A0AAX1N8M6_9BACT|nr:hypothetical protein [Flammeovirga yaeyamensis]MBB3700479.1 hypothetical protein [Flammeovirga yaeyamensis]NMF36898.1 hypothetical protein [Flammeovirga yaeyamensis]QWG02555.1 hypothetical protein KMW28_02980 [Flammeovirga yaeyamensis]
MRKLIYIITLGIAFTFQSCELYDTYSEELNAGFSGSTVSFETATTSPDSVRENSIPLSLVVEMPYAIQTSRGVEVKYSFAGDAVFGTDFTAKAIERNEANSSVIVEKFATENGGTFIIKNREKTQDESGEQSFTNTRNTATIEVSPLVVQGVDKPNGKFLSVILSSAKNLDDNSEVTVGQGGIKREYNLLIRDIHCPSDLDGTYAARITKDEGIVDVPDVTITKTADSANPDNIWGLYEISNIAGDLQDIPFQIIDQCGEFLGPSDEYITISGTTASSGEISLDVLFSDGITTRQWTLFLTKK